jgi:hypothetical protein
MLPELTEFRQSTLRAMEVCPRRTRKSLEAGDVICGWTGHATQLGTVFHAFVDAYMDTLAMPEVRPAQQLSTEEAVVICREVYDASEIVLPADEYNALIGMACRFCEFKWDVNRIATKEDALRLDLVCPDGEVRTFKGAPDLIMFDPPQGLIVYDWKTGQGQPKSPRKREEDGEAVEGEQYLSDVGKYQRQAYGLLALRAFPAAQYAVLWEVPMRFAKHGPRYARITREQLEHVEKRLASHMMKLDRGLREGPASDVWLAKPGSQCHHCEAARGCPVPPAMRGVGAITNQTEADIEARRFVRGDAMKEQARERLKAWQEESGGKPGRVNEREEVRWGPDPDAWREKGGGRKFDVHAAEMTSTEDAA